MFNTMLWTHRRERQFNLGGGGAGDKKTEYLLIAALAVVIVGSIALTIWLGAKSNEPPKGPKRMFECSQCEHVFEVPPKKITGDERPLAPDELPPAPDCPECGAEGSGMPMVQCPNPDCGKYFVSPRLDWNPTMTNRRSGSTPPDEICPYCKTDRMKWYREHRKK